MTLTRLTKITCAALLALAAACPQLVLASSTVDKIATAKQKIAALAQAQQSTKQKLVALYQKEQDIRTQIAQVQSHISQLTTTIYTTQADIGRRDLKIKQLEADIAKTKADMNAQYAVLVQRVRTMYEAGHTSYLAVLFSATSFSDLLSRMRLLSFIAAQDRAVFQSIQASKRHLDATHTELLRQQQTESHAFAILMAKQAQAQQAQQVERRLLSQVQSQQTQEQVALQDENNAMKNLQSLISQLQASLGSYTGPSGGWTWPVPGYRTISSPYGWRTWPDGSKEFHPGIDIPAPIGTPIVAATSGKVLYAGPASGYGDWIVIESQGGLIEVYGHMYAYEIKVTPGQDVQTGQPIAAVGNNGNSTGPHLHFTIAKGFNAAGFPISMEPTQYVGT